VFGSGLDFSSGNGISVTLGDDCLPGLRLICDLYGRGLKVRGLLLKVLRIFLQTRLRGAMGLNLYLKTAESKLLLLSLMNCCGYQSAACGGRRRSAPYATSAVHGGCLFSLPGGQLEPPRCSPAFLRAAHEADAVQMVQPLFAELVAASGAARERECVQVVFIENPSVTHRRIGGNLVRFPFPFSLIKRKPRLHVRNPNLVRFPPISDHRGKSGQMLSRLPDLVWFRFPSGAVA
jgi:hypothetical protein